MSRFILGDCVQVMSRFPSRAVDFILADPPYLVGYKDRTGRTIAGDNTESQHRHDAATLAERMAAQTLRRINALLMEAYREALVLDETFQD